MKTRKKASQVRATVGSRPSGENSWSSPERGEFPIASVKAAGAPNISANPFPLPAVMSPALASLLTYWNALKRGNAEIPFGDDVQLSAVGEISKNIVLLDVFEKPQHFRIELSGINVSRSYGDNLDGMFLDETELRSPLEYLRSQCTATIEAHAPTFYANDGNRGYGRILLPLWADGRVASLLGAIEGNEYAAVDADAMRDDDFAMLASRNTNRR